MILAFGICCTFKIVLLPINTNVFYVLLFMKNKWFSIRLSVVFLFIHVIALFIFLICAIDCKRTRESCVPIYRDGLGVKSVA